MSSADPQPASVSSNSDRETHQGLLKNLGITFFENVMTKGLSFLVILVLTRSLGPEAYGQYSFIFVTVALCSALFDFGMENTAVRFAAKEKDKRDKIFGLYLLIKLSILAVLAAFFLVGGEWLFQLMEKGAVVKALPFLIVGLIGESLFFVNDTWLQANRQFQLRAVLNIARFGATLLYVWSLMFTGAITLDKVLWIYVIPLAFSLFFLKRYVVFIAAFLKGRIRRMTIREILEYERWMFTYSIANNMLGRVDFFMLSFWMGFGQLGIYNAAVQLCAIVSFLPLVLGKVLLPTLSEQSEHEILHTTGRMVRATAVLSFGIAVLTPLSQWVVPVLLGREYAASTTVLQILMLAFTCGLLSMPYEQALYSLGKPRLMSNFRYLQLGVIVILNLLTVPILGIYGAAMSALVGRLLYLLFVHRAYREHESVFFKNKMVTAPAGIPVEGR